MKRFVSYGMGLVRNVKNKRRDSFVFNRINYNRKMKQNKQNHKKSQLNIYLKPEDREIVDELMRNNINISSTLKMFLRKYLKKIKKLNNDINI